MARSPYTIDPRNPPRIDIPAPFCATCQRTVDQVRFRYSPSREAYIVEAICHGAVETAELPIALAFEDGTVTAAVVFQPRLGAPDEE